MPSAGVLPIKPLAQSRLYGPMGIGFPRAAQVAAGGKGFQCCAEATAAGVGVVYAWEEVGCWVFRCVSWGAAAHHASFRKCGV